jgi:hypothetical protein
VELGVEPGTGSGNGGRVGSEDVKNFDVVFEFEQKLFENYLLRPAGLRTGLGGCGLVLPGPDYRERFRLEPALVQVRLRR